MFSCEAFLSKSSRVKTYSSRIPQTVSVVIFAPNVR